MSSEQGTGPSSSSVASWLLAESYRVNTVSTSHAVGSSIAWVPSVTVLVAVRVNEKKS